MLTFSEWELSEGAAKVISKYARMAIKRSRFMGEGSA